MNFVGFDSEDFFNLILYFNENLRFEQTFSFHVNIDFAFYIMKFQFGYPLTLYKEYIEIRGSNWVRFGQVY